MERKLDEIEIRERIESIQISNTSVGACGVMVIVVGIGLGDTSSDPGRG